MTQLSFDIVVVGSGPAGATTARVAAEQGLHVLLIDKRQELGAPVQCSGAVSRHGLVDAGVMPNEEFIQEAIYGFGIYNEAGEKTVIDYRNIKPDEYGTGAGKVPLGYVVDRRRFDRYLMTKAERAGVEVWLKTEGLGYETDDSEFCTLHVQRYGEKISIKTRVVVGADGLQSQVGKWAGLRTHIRLTELASCLQYVVDQVETEGLLEIVTGHEWAPGGYAWVFPKGHGYAEIGLGVIRHSTEKDARWHLKHFMEHSFFKERFAKAKILEVQCGGVPLASPLKIQYADHLILVGDAARHVNPITGGGIHTALASGVIAGKYLAETIAAGGKATADRLQGYQDIWRKDMGDKMWQLFYEKASIFTEQDISVRNRRLYHTMSEYFSPNSLYKKI